MTREEAIERLNIHKSTSVFVDSIAEALDMAIEALSQPAEADRPTGEWKGYNADNPDWLRKDGTPIFLVCDKCHDMVLNNSSTNWNYCPNCGARMKGGAE